MRLLNLTPYPLRTAKNHGKEIGHHTALCDRWSEILFQSPAGTIWFLEIVSRNWQTRKTSKR